MPISSSTGLPDVYAYEDVLDDTTKATSTNNVFYDSYYRAEIGHLREGDDNKEDIEIGHGKNVESTGLAKDVLEGEDGIDKEAVVLLNHRVDADNVRSNYPREDYHSSWSDEEVANRRFGHGTDSNVKKVRLNNRVADVDNVRSNYHQDDYHSSWSDEEADGRFDNDVHVNHQEEMPSRQDQDENYQRSWSDREPKQRFEDAHHGANVLGGMQEQDDHHPGSWMERELEKAESVETGDLPPLVVGGESLEETENNNKGYRGRRDVNSVEGK